MNFIGLFYQIIPDYYFTIMLQMGLMGICDEKGGYICKLAYLNIKKTGIKPVFFILNLYFPPLPGIRHRRSGASFLPA